MKTNHATYAYYIHVHCARTMPFCGIFAKISVAVLLMVDVFGGKNNFFLTNDWKKYSDTIEAGMK